jgi:hypothetical protein
MADKVGAISLERAVDRDAQVLGGRGDEAVLVLVCGVGGGTGVSFSSFLPLAALFWGCSAR